MRYDFDSMPHDCRAELLAAYGRLELDALKSVFEISLYSPLEAGNQTEAFSALKGAAKRYRKIQEDILDSLNE